MKLTDVMESFLHWIETKGFYYSFAKEALEEVTSSRICLLWAFLKRGVIEKTRLQALHPEIINKRGAMLNIGLPFTGSYRIKLSLETDTIYIDTREISHKTLYPLLLSPVFNQNIGAIWIADSDKIPILQRIIEESITQYYTETTNIQEIFLTKVAHLGGIIPIIATNLQEEKIIVYISEKEIVGNFTGDISSFDRIQIPFSLEEKELRYFYRYI